MLKMLKANVVVVAALFLAFLKPQTAMATGGGEPTVSIDGWGIVALIAAVCLAYKLIKK